MYIKTQDCKKKRLLKVNVDRADWWQKHADVSATNQDITWWMGKAHISYESLLVHWNQWSRLSLRQWGVSYQSFPLKATLTQGIQAGDGPWPCLHLNWLIYGACILWLLLHFRSQGIIWNSLLRDTHQRPNQWQKSLSYFQSPQAKDIADQSR